MDLVLMPAHVEFTRAGQSMPEEEAKAANLVYSAVRE